MKNKCHSRAVICKAILLISGCDVGPGVGKRGLYQLDTSFYGHKSHQAAQYHYPALDIKTAPQACPGCVLFPAFN